MPGIVNLGEILVWLSNALPAAQMPQADTDTRPATETETQAAPANRVNPMPEETQPPSN